MDCWNFVARFDLVLASMFSSLGICVARSPTSFLLVPLLITGLLATGLPLFQYEADTEYLFVPVAAPSVRDRGLLDQVFPPDINRFVMGTSSSIPYTVFLIVTSRNESLPSVMSRSLWEEVSSLVTVVQQMRLVADKDNVITDFGWQDVCATFLGKCVENSYLSLVDNLTNLAYPITRDQATGTLHPLMVLLGGVEVGQEGTVTEAKAMKLMFPLDVRRMGREAAMLWSSAVQDLVEQVQLEKSRVEFLLPDSLEIGLETNVHACMELLPFTIVVVTVFTILNCFSTDWVRSKPLMGAVGLINVILGMIAGYGAAIYLGFEWQAINLISPFLLLGIGLDGVFLMMSSWTRSEVAGCDLAARIALTYSDVSVSLTISTITNIFSFLVGSLVPGFPCIRLFCVYTGFGLLFNYFWIITMFGSVLTWCGQLEQDSRHCLLMVKVKPASEGVSWLYRLLLAGGGRREEVKDPKMMSFFRDVFSPFLKWRWARVMVFVVFACYLVVAVMGVAMMNVGLDRSKVFLDDSHAVNWFKQDDQYFRDYPFRLQVAITEQLDYHNETVQHQVVDLIDKYESSEFVSNNSALRQSWLHEFLRMAEENFLVFNITTEQQFMSGLHRFMESPEVLASPLVNDVKFDEEGKKLIASRFFLQSSRVESAFSEMKMLDQLRKIAADAPFNVTVNHPYFTFFDQFKEVLPTTIQTTIILCLIMTIITVIFVPNRTSLVWVIFTILSVQLGLIGFMSLWSVNLDTISMIVLIMGIGFSVDFSAHVSYHYLAADRSLSPTSRLADCLHGLGPPIVQGATTSLLGVIPLSIHPSYVLRTFSKMVSLVIGLGLVHSLFLLPSLLVLLGPGSCGGSEDQKKKTISTQVLSPSLHSQTFVYKNHKDNSEKGCKALGKGGLGSLRKLAISGHVQRHNKLGEGLERESVTPFLDKQSLHLSFFRPNDSEYSGVSLDSPAPDSSNSDRARSASDSSYYSCQARHLRRGVKGAGGRISFRRACLSPSIASPAVGKKNRSDLYTSLLNDRSTSMDNDNYDSGGLVNQGFQEDEVNMKVASPTLETFKGKQEQKDSDGRTGDMQKTKIVCVNYQEQDSIILSPCMESYSQPPMPSDQEDLSSDGDSFEEVNLEK